MVILKMAAKFLKTISCQNSYQHFILPSSYLALLKNYLVFKISLKTKMKTKPHSFFISFSGVSKTWNSPSIFFKRFAWREWERSPEDLSRRSVMLLNFCRTRSRVQCFCSAPRAHSQMVWGLRSAWPHLSIPLRLRNVWPRSVNVRQGDKSPRGCSTCRVVGLWCADN